MSMRLNSTVKLTSLRKTYSETGVVGTITVVPIPGTDKYNLEDGFENYILARDLKIDIVPCSVSSNSIIEKGHDGWFRIKGRPGKYSTHNAARSVLLHPRDSKRKNVIK